MSYHTYRKMLRRRWAGLCLALMFLSFLLGWGLSLAHAQVPFDVLFVRSPRTGADLKSSPLPDVAKPLHLPPGSDLVLLKAGEHTPTVLVDTQGKGAIFDPVMSYDGQWVYYSFCPDMTLGQLGLPIEGCDIYKRRFSDGLTIQLTTQAETWRPHGSMAKWSKVPNKADPPGSVHLGHGIYNMAPVPLPSEGGERFLFTSNMQALDTIAHFGGTNVSFQLYAYNGYHGSIEQVWHSPAAILHPFMLANGEIAFSTMENHMNRDSRPWGLWASRPDGSQWHPILSATMDPLHARHFCTGTADLQVVCTNYYLMFNSGLGTLFKNALVPQLGFNAPAFGPPDARKNPPIPTGANSTWRHAYTPVGLHSLTPWTHMFDRKASLGKAGHPWAAPNGDILVSYSAGPVHGNDPPPANVGVYVIPGGIVTDSPTDLVQIYMDPAYNAIFPRPVVSWKATYGTAMPPRLSDAPNDGKQHAMLPAGTPFALVGSSSVWRGETRAGQFDTPWQGQRALYGYDESRSSNLDWQGAEARPHANADIAKIQFIVQAGVSHVAYNDPFGGYKSDVFRAKGGNERWQVIGEVDPYKYDPSGQPILDPWGDPDTSFLVRLPCQTSWGIRLITKDGEVMTHAGTWKPQGCGEVFHPCQGCHNHGSPPRDYAQTIAGQAGFVPTDLTATPLTASEFISDIIPILRAKCVSCHMGGVSAPGGLDLNDTSLVNGIPRNAAILTDNHLGALGGYGPVSGTRYPPEQTSRWVRPFSAARSLLWWVVKGSRADGFTNADFVTESVPGDRTTLPPNTPSTQIDIDYLPSLHASHIDVTLTSAEKLLIAQWIDNGAPVDRDPKRGWKWDEWVPVLVWHLGQSQITLGMYDVGSGLNLTTLTVTRDGQAVTPVAIADSRWTLPRVKGRYVARVVDKAGNMTELRRRVE